MLHIVDDEEVIRDALAWLAQSRDIKARCHASAQQFLDAIDGRFDAGGDCVLLDVRMPDISGVGVFDQLSARGLKRGAFDFFEKPFNDNALMDRVQEAMASSRAAGAVAQVQARLASLSVREREVLDLILAGMMNKVVADKLGISMRTVEVHRAHIFDKMQVKTAVELAGLLK